LLLERARNLPVAKQGSEIELAAAVASNQLAVDDAGLRRNAKMVAAIG